MTSMTTINKKFMKNIIKGNGIRGAIQYLKNVPQDQRWNYYNTLLEQINVQVKNRSGKREYRRSLERLYQSLSYSD